MRSFSAVAIVLLFSVCVAPVSAQYLGILPSAEDETNVQESVRSVSRIWAARTSDSAFGVLNPVVELRYNSGDPFGGNDRGLWQGRGFNSFASGGIAYSAPHVDLVFAPEITFSQNVGFAYRPPQSGDPRFGNYGTAIDQPQRFGDQPFADVWLGNTSATVHHWNTALRVGTESLVFGPGEQNNLILSDNAPGFPHIEFGTYTPWTTRAGNLDWQLLWGRLAESDFFDDDGSNDSRLFVAGALGYQPSFAPGWQFSVYRAIQSPWSTIDAYKVFQLFEALWKENRRSYADTPTGEDDTDQVISVAMEYRAPCIPFRVYLEWARNDHAANPEDFLANPEHSRAYTTGFDYETSVFASWSLSFAGEITVINPSPTNPVRPTGPWYRHVAVGGQGYTHHGQYLGAWIGSGANSQYAEIGMSHTPSGISATGFVERVVFDNDFFYALSGQSYLDFNYALLGGVRTEVPFRGGRVRSELAGGYHANPYWLDEGRRPMIRAALSVEYDL